MADYRPNPSEWHRHDAWALKGVSCCPACRAPGSVLLAYKTGDERLFLMCLEVEEMWSHPDRVDEAPDLGWRDLRAGYGLASRSDLIDGGWDADRFVLTEQWWTD